VVTVARERIRTRPYEWQQVPWTDGQVLTRGSVDGLPALTWGRADRAQLATARQLRELGLRPAGQQPVAVLVFGHRQPGRRPIEYTSLYRIADAEPKRVASPAQRDAIEKALAARRTCQRCGHEQGYYLSTVSRMCGPCSDATGYWDDRAGLAPSDADDAESWQDAHDEAMRAEDPYRPITELDVDEPEARDALPEPAPVNTNPPPPDETAQAIERTQLALARIAQRRAEVDARAADAVRGDRLARWHGDDQAVEQDALGTRGRTRARRRPVMTDAQEPRFASAAALAGLAAEVEALRRATDPLRQLPARVDELARLLARVADELADHTAHAGPAAPPSWLILPTDSTIARQVLGELTGWMGAVYLRYADAAASLPDCWLWHPDVVEELLWLMHAWATAYQGSAASVALAGDWHDRYRPGVVRRIKATTGTCSLENHPGRNARPDATGDVPLAEAADGIAAWWATHRDQPAPEPTEQQLAAADRRQRGGLRR
jgi:hypothetical protein